MKAFFTLALVGILITAWCPWFEVGEAKQLIYNSVRESQSTLQNGCVLTIDTKSLEKIPFGYRQNVAYDCTFNTDFITEGKNVVFVSFFKTVLNVPHPVIK
jgi:hypothetical protein